MSFPYRGRTVIEITHPNEDLSFRNLTNVGEVAAKLDNIISAVAAGISRPTTSIIVTQGGTQATGTVTLVDVGGTAATGSVALSGVGGTAATGSYALSNVGGMAATGSVALTGVGGTAATGTVTLAGGAGDVTIVTDGTSVGPVAFNGTDAQTALDCITALNADGTFAAKATASDGGAAVVLITWDTKGVVGNSKTLTASRSAGTATASGATLAGGVDGSVAVTLNGILVTTDTTNQDDDTAAASIAAAIELDVTLAPLVTATSAGPDVNLAWVAKGTAGNVVLVATTATGTSVVSAATLTGGAQGAVTLVINGVSVGPTDTTNISDTAAATAVAAAIELNATLGPLLVAVGSTADVNLTWSTKGTVGNAVTLAAGTSATGTATRSAATLTGGAQGSVGVTIDGELVTTNTTTLSDTAAATAVAAAIELNATLGPLLVAAGSTADVTLAWVAKGTAGNVTLSATSATGTATRSAATLTGGAQGSVTVTINGTAEVTNTTNLTDTAAATLVTTEINANATITPLATATSLLGVVTVEAVAYGVGGNAITLTSSTATGTAVSSVAKLAGGVDAVGEELRRQ